MMSSPRFLHLSALFSLVVGMLCPSIGFGQEFQLESAPPKKDFANPLIQLGAPGAKAAKPTLEARLTPKKGTVADLKPGDEVTLSLKFSVGENSYTYSMTTPFGQPTSFKVGKLVGLEPVDQQFQADREPKTVIDPDVGAMEKFEKTVTFSRTYRLADGAKVADVLVEGKLDAQVCDDSSCRQLSEPFQASLVADGSGKSVVFKERPKLLGKKPGPAVLTATLAPKDAKPGDKVTLTIEMALDEGWHTYSITQKNVLGAKPTEIEIEHLKNLKALGESFTPSQPFETKKEDLGFEVVEHEIHHGKIAWSRDYQVLEAAATEGFGIQGNLDYQTCQRSCVPGAFAFDLQSQTTISRGMETPGTIVAETEAEAVPDSLEARLAALLGTADAEAATEEAAPASESGSVKSQGLFWFIVAAVSAGFLALLTPCVYPMVPITISFFLKQAEKQHHRPLTLALVYCFGIMATFTGLGLLISALFEVTDLNRLANNVWLNLMLTAVIGFFGISMLGMFEIRVPSGLLTWSAGKEQKGGIIGTLFMAFTFTLVSFTCTFAFAGALLVMASKGEVFWPIVGMLAFSGAFAFPFFLLALFPKFLTKLPKSGGWMNIIKVTMGFIEVGAALKFLSVADASHFGQPTYLPYGAVMGAWFLLALLAGLYPMGLFRMPHDTPGKFTFGRLAFGAPFLALAGLIGLGLFTSYQPSGWVWDNIAAFAPPRFEVGTDQSIAGDETEADIGPYLEHDGLKYALNFFEALDHARETNRPLFVDFTGINCINCRKMEQSVLPKPPNRERLEKFVRVQLFTDTIPNIDDPEQRERLLNINRKLQVAFEDVSLPGYVVLNPHDVAENGRLKQLSFYKGMERNPGEFTQFLDEGLAKWQEQAGQTDIETAGSETAPDTMTAQR